MYDEVSKAFTEDGKATLKRSVRLPTGLIDNQPPSATRG
jgi:hypothetical protein